MDLDSSAARRRVTGAERQWMWMEGVRTDSSGRWLWLSFHEQPDVASDPPVRAPRSSDSSAADTASGTRTAPSPSRTSAPPFSGDSIASGTGSGTGARSETSARTRPSGGSTRGRSPSGRSRAATSRGGQRRSLCNSSTPRPSQNPPSRRRRGCPVLNFPNLHRCKGHPRDGDWLQRGAS